MPTSTPNTLGYVEFGGAKMGIGTSSGVAFEPLTPTGTGTTTTGGTSTSGRTTTSGSTTSGSTTSGSTTSGSTSPDPVFPGSDPTVSPSTPVVPPSKPDPALPADPKWYGYYHFATDIGETTNLHWFTQDERELLIAIYNKLKGGIQVFISPEARVLTWTIQPGSYAGLQKLPIVCPFDGTLVGMVASSVDWGTQDTNIILQRATAQSMNSQGAPVWNTVSPFILQHATLNSSSRIEQVLPAATDPAITCSKGEVFDINVATGAATIGLISAATVQLYIKLKDSTANAGIDLSGLKYDPAKYTTPSV